MTNMTPDQIQKQIESLQTRHQKVTARKAELAGELKAKKDELSALIEEIKAAGYDPKSLKQAREDSQLELERLMTVFDKDLTDIETALNTYEKG